MGLAAMLAWRNWIGLILMHGWVDLLCPGVDAAEKVVHMLKARGTQLVDAARGTHAGAAKEHIGLLRVELLQPLTETLNGNVERAWQGRPLHLHGRAPPDQPGRSLRRSRVGKLSVPSTMMS